MTDGLAPMYRMPVTLGPAPGPRNLPAESSGRRYEKSATTFTLSAATDAQRLARMLPAGFTLDGEAPIELVHSGAGSFQFHRWQDMPTQYLIVNALADLPLADFGPATLVETSGGGDASGQRRLR